MGKFAELQFIEAAMYRVAIDTGGTFTDFVFKNTDTGRMTFWKTLSTPRNPQEAVLRGVSHLMDELQAHASQIDEILLATTVATNAVLERKGCLTGLITTRGFRDVLIIGRQKRYDTYDLYLEKPVPLVKRRHIQEVDERVGYDGGVIRQIEMESVQQAIGELTAAGVESIAVSLLHAYANPSHEQAIEEQIRAQAPQVSVSLSSDVSPKYREYERTSTTVANAYIKPIVALYLEGLTSVLQQQGIAAPLYIMQSNGGLITPDLARKYPIAIVESGPSAGVLMCGLVGRTEGFENVLTFDMGGTTAKMGALEGGQPAIAPAFEVDGINFRKYSGLPVNMPAIELIEIGAGGGSIATTRMGLVQVGPRSAGADPGPVCYGQGGSQATLTDANVALGYIDPDNFAGGRMAIDSAAAEAIIDAQIAQPLNLSLTEAAWGVHAVANANMERAMRSMSMDRGRDPRNYAMVAFGGAGPMHAVRLARALSVPHVIIPWGAGVGSAIGLLEADQQFNVSTTNIITVSPDSTATIAAIYEKMEHRVRGEVAEIAKAPKVYWKRFAYLRYSGQGYEIKIDLPDGEIEGDFATRMVSAFHDSYKNTYGYSQQDGQIEAADWYLTAVLPTESRSPPQPEANGHAADRGPAPVATRKAYLETVGDFADCAAVDRYALQPGDRVRGPAIIAERESTTVLLPGDEAVVSPARHLIITINSATSSAIDTSGGEQ